MFASMAVIRSADSNEKTSMLNDVLVQIFSYCLSPAQPLFHTLLPLLVFFNHFYQIYIKVMVKMTRNADWLCFFFNVLSLSFSPSVCISLYILFLSTIPQVHQSHLSVTHNKHSLPTTFTGLCTFWLNCLWSARFLWSNSPVAGIRKQRVRRKGSTYACDRGRRTARKGYIKKVWKRGEM